MRRHDDADDQSRSRSRSWLSPTSGRRPRRHSSTTLILGGLAVLMAAVLVGGSLVVYVKYRTVWDGINRVNVLGDLGGKRPPVDPKALNLLVIGSDSRAGRNAKAGGQDGNVGQRSDTIMLSATSRLVAHNSSGRGAEHPARLSPDPEACTPEDHARLGELPNRPSDGVEQEQFELRLRAGQGAQWRTWSRPLASTSTDFVELTFVGFERVIDEVVEASMPMICSAWPAH